MHDDGTSEATVHGGYGAVSQPGQRAPFNAGYGWLNTTRDSIVPDPKTVGLNPYTEW